jgi:hypothetical protein
VALISTDDSEEPIAFIIRVKRIFLKSVFRLLVTANVVPSLQILVNMIMEAILFSEISVLKRATWRNIPEECILHSHCRENLKSYKVYSVHI